MASNGQLLPIMAATPHKLIILSFLLTVRLSLSHPTHLALASDGGGGDGSGYRESQEGQERVTTSTASLCLPVITVNTITPSKNLLTRSLFTDPVNFSYPANMGRYPGAAYPDNIPNPAKAEYPGEIWTC